MKAEVIKKREVEALLKCEITDDQFHEALRFARRKQEYIYRQEQRSVVLQHWYLVKLTEEYVHSLALSKVTMDLCGKDYNTEKEHSVQTPERPNG